MGLKLEEWQEIIEQAEKDFRYAALCEDRVLEFDIIERIKEELKARDRDTYEAWEKNGFDVKEYLFTIESCESFTFLDIVQHSRSGAFSSKSLLHWTAQHGLSEAVKYLIDKKNFSVDGTYVDKTPLHLAAEYGRLKTVQVLLDRGAIVDEKDHDHCTPLYLATRYGHLETVKALLGKGADPNLLSCRSRGGDLPLYFAIENNNLKMVKVLLDKGADFIITGRRILPLHYAVEKGNLEIVKALLDKYDETNTPPCLKEVLCVAAAVGDLGIIQFLLDKYDETNDPLYLEEVLLSAVRADSLEAVKFLVKKGVNPFAAYPYKTFYSRTNFFFAVFHNRLDIVQFLLDEGADVNSEKLFDETLLHFAIQNGMIDLAKLIVNHIAKLEAAGLYVSEENLKKKDEFIKTSNEERNNYLQHFQSYKGEAEKIKTENEPLYDFLRESNINNLVSIWERNENLRSRFDNQESLQEQYPEYSHILINKANEVKKEIFLHNNKQLIDILSIRYARDFKTMTFYGINTFFEMYKGDVVVELGGIEKSLTEFVDFKDIRKREVPKLELQAFARSIKNEGVGSNLECPNSLDNEIKSSIQDNGSVQHIIEQKDSVDRSGSTSQSEQEELSQLETQNQDTSEIAGTVKHTSTSYSEASLELDGNSGQQSLQPETSVRAFVATDQKNGTQSNSVQPSNQNKDVNTSHSTQESKWPVVAVSTLAIAGVALGVAIAVYLEMLAVGIGVVAVGACCLVAAAIIYCCSGPSNSLEKSSAEAVAATIGTPLKP